MFVHEINRKICTRALFNDIFLQVEKFFFAAENFRDLREIFKTWYAYKIMYSEWIFYKLRGYFYKKQQAVQFYKN